MIERPANVPDCSHLPGSPQQRLSDADRARLERATELIAEAERRWAEVVKDLRYAAVARELGVTAEAVRKRALRRLEK